jgi:hypothetical protein
MVVQLNIHYIKLPFQGGFFIVSKITSEQKGNPEPAYGHQRRFWSTPNGETIDRKLIDFLKEKEKTAQLAQFFIIKASLKVFFLIILTSYLIILIPTVRSWSANFSFNRDKLKLRT